MAAVMLLLLAGCGMFDRRVPPPCPPVMVPKDASTVTEYRPGGGHEIIDVVLRGRIADFTGGCEWNGDRTRVDVNLAIVFEIERGPAAPDRTGRFRYFVAIPAFYPEPEGKKVYPVEVQFPGNIARLRAHETVHLQIPVARNKRGNDYPIYLGFQLTPEQAEENRRKTSGP